MEVSKPIEERMRALEDKVWTLEVVQRAVLQASGMDAKELEELLENVKPGSRERAEIVDRATERLLDSLGWRSKD